MIRPTAPCAGCGARGGALVLAACGGGSDDDSADSSSSASPSESRSAATTGDGTLTVGTLLPQTGDLAFLGPPEFAGVDLAVKDINAAGGVLGKAVTQAKADSGDGTPDIAGARSTSCSTPNADVIVGAASSSRLAERHRQDHRRGRRRVLAGQHVAGLRHLRRQGPVLPYRPVRRAPGRRARQPGRRGRLQERRDPGPPGLLRRGPGRPGREDARGAGRQRSPTKVLYSADATNYTAEVNKIAARKPDALVLIAFEETTKIIPQLIAKGIGPQDIQIYFVDGNTADYSKGLRPGHPRRASRPPSRPAELDPTSRRSCSTIEPEAQGLHLRSRVLRRHGHVGALAADAAKDDSGEAIAVEASSTSPRTARSARRTRTAPSCSRTARTSTTTAVSGPVDLNDDRQPVSKATIGIQLVRRRQQVQADRLGLRRRRVTH